MGQKESEWNKAKDVLTVETYLFNHSNIKAFTITKSCVKEKINEIYIEKESVVFFISTDISRSAAGPEYEK